MKPLRELAGIFLIVALVMSVGCEETLDEPQQAGAPSGDPELSSEPVKSTSTGGNSSLGGAKRTAENTATQLEQRSQEIANQLENDE